MFIACSDYTFPQRMLKNTQLRIMLSKASRGHLKRSLFSFFGEGEGEKRHGKFFNIESPVRLVREVILDKFCRLKRFSMKHFKEYWNKVCDDHTLRLRLAVEDQIMESQLM